MTFFVVAHEMAHHILGHLSTRIRPTDEALDRLGVSFYLRSQECEFEADRLGLEILVHHLRSEERTYAELTDVAFAPLLFFQFLAFIEVLLAIRWPGRELPRTHPIAGERLLRLERILENDHLDGWRTFYKGIQYLFHVLHESTTKL